MLRATLDLRLRRLAPTNLIGRIWKGAYFSSFAPLQVQDGPAWGPLPGADWVRVRNRLAGICGSYLHVVFTDGDPRLAVAAVPKHTRSYPGHEVVGEVIEAGCEANGLRVGDRVVKQSEVNCLTAGVEQPCATCAQGYYSLCSRVDWPDPQPMDGGWSAQMLLPARQLFRVPPALSDEQAVMLEPTAVAVHAVLRRLPQAGEKVLVVGAGTIGLLVLQVLRALSPQAEVSVLARHTFQQEQARRSGAAHLITMRQSYQQIAEITGARHYTSVIGNQMLLGGYDVVYDTVGSETTVQHSLRWTRARGTVVLLGVNLHLLHLDLSPVWYQEVNLVGAMAHSREDWSVDSGQAETSFDLAARLMGEKQIHPEQLITHRFARSAYRKALQVAAQKSSSGAIKVVLQADRS